MGEVNRLRHTWASFDEVNKRAREQCGVASLGVDGSWVQIHIRER
jgi:hypothetical protein